MRLNSDFETPREILEDGSEPIHGFSPPYSHLEYFFCRWPLDYPTLPESIIKFSFVRNPYDRFYSFFKSKISGGQSPGKYYEKYGIKRGCTFDECVNKITTLDPDHLEHHSAPQTMLLFDGCDLLVDFVGKVENFSFDWPVIQKLVGTNLTLERANVSEGKKEVVYTDELKKKIYDYYYYDFKVLGYNSELEILDEQSNREELNKNHRHYLNHYNLDELRERIFTSNKKVRDLADSFCRDRIKLERFLNHQNELLHELLLKKTSYLDSEIDKQKNTQYVFDNELKKSDNEIKKTQLKLEQTQQEFKNYFQKSEKRTESIIYKTASLESHLVRLVLTLYVRTRKSIWWRLYRFLWYPKRKEIKCLRDSGLVDPHYYFKTYPDAITGGMTAAEHYVRYGAMEGRNPSENFNTLKYLVEHPEITKIGLNPLVHYIMNR
jgi:hypothetical protein